MASFNWVKPENSKAKVNAAGKVIASAGTSSVNLHSDALNIVNNWRSSHAFPLNTLKMSLRNNAKSIDSDAIVSQRLKRLVSIENKLNRSGTMNLSQMNDIGGCRAIVRTVTLAERLVDRYLGRRTNHKLRSKYDYIANPKPSGYRGYHLVYDYRVQIKKEYNGLRIEMQIRSLLQHMWATTVETVETFRKEALKSGEGNQQWLRFFALMGSHFAMRENRPVIPGTSGNRRILFEEIKYLVHTLDVLNRLDGYRHMVRVMDALPSSRNLGYVLLRLDWSEDGGKIYIDRFRQSNLEAATSAYYELEQQLSEGANGEVVLVSEAAVTELSKAFPNYFPDTTQFLRTLRGIMNYRQPGAKSLR